MSKEQVVLGINGWLKRTHSASACIVIDGKVISFAEEERFSRKKHSFGELPTNAIAYCLNDSKLIVDDIDCVAVGWDYRKLYESANVEEPRLDDLVSVYLPKNLYKYSKEPRFELVPHHLAHAASSYYLSGFKRAAIIVIDGQGESQSTSVAIGEDGKIKIVQEYPIKDSLGYFYEAASEYLGFSTLEPGKTMGLAGYGHRRLDFDDIVLTNSGYELDIHPSKSLNALDEQQSVTEYWLKCFTQKYGYPNKPVSIYDPDIHRLRGYLTFSQDHKDFAASVQGSLEDTVSHLIKKVVKDTDCRFLCLSGGVALNCSMNGRIMHEHLVDDLFVPPFTNDAGVSIGAALLLSDRKPQSRLDTAYFGPQFSNDSIRNILEKYGCKYQRVEDIGFSVANLLADNRIVSWFQGKMEAGPRALGNRSILGNPSSDEMNRRMNAAKTRESWRPLSPSILDLDQGELLDDSFASPFMLCSFQINDEKRSEITAAVHVDQTTRPQTVSRRVNPRYYHLIEQFKKLTGVPAIMNTSFNGKTEPIVCNPYDAVCSFYSNTTDYLAIGDYLVSKT